MRSQHESVEAPPPAHTERQVIQRPFDHMACVYWLYQLPAQVVEDGHVGVHVVQIVRVRRVVVVTPARWRRTVQVEDVMLRFGLVINTVESNHLNIKKRFVAYS